VSETLLDVRGLTVAFPTHEGDVLAVSDLSYTLHRGETLGIVGESGSGKSVSSLALMGLLNQERTRISGEAMFGGRNLLSLSPEHMREIRGKDIAMIFQDPFACLHPMYRVGDQIAEAVTAHASVSKSKALDRAVELLDAVGIPKARDRAEGRLPSASCEYATRAAEIGPIDVINMRDNARLSATRARRPPVTTLRAAGAGRVCRRVAWRALQTGRQSIRAYAGSVRNSTKRSSSTISTRMAAASS